jgi:hypothetical protein
MEHAGTTEGGETVGGSPWAVSSARVGARQDNQRPLHGHQSQGSDQGSVAEIDLMQADLTQIRSLEIRVGRPIRLTVPDGYK